MKSNEIITFLQNHNYTYTSNNKTITVNLELAQNVLIDVSNPEKIILKDELVFWNFLTGAIKMSLKNAIVYNFILILLFGFLCHYLEFTNQNYTNLFLILISWILLFSTFYLIKLESFKLQLATAIK